jgi:hypothetical protein
VRSTKERLAIESREVDAAEATALQAGRLRSSRIRHHDDTNTNNEQRTTNNELCYTLTSEDPDLISSVTGFTQGLKHSQLRRIERLATRRVPAAQIISQELARQMSEISLETGRQIGVLINRKGQVEYVMVGNAKQIEMPTSAARVLRPSVFAVFGAFTRIFKTRS